MRFYITSNMETHRYERRRRASHPTTPTAAAASSSNPETQDARKRPRTDD
jgi:hypothetical protein